MRTGLPVSDVKVTPISDAADGTQIWRITHNGVDTHPIHFHLYDVQIVNRVTWDNIIIPTEPSELGWKDTVRVSPLEDTIVALRPIIPQVPFELPNAIRPLNPMMPLGSTAMFNNVDPQGNPTNPIVNQLVNFGWEYTYHCHILSHEEMDMMRPVSVALPPNKPDWAHICSHREWQQHTTGAELERQLHQRDLLRDPELDLACNLDGRGCHSLTVGSAEHPSGTFLYGTGHLQPESGIQYRVVAKNTVGYGLEFPTMTVQSVSDVLSLGTPPAAPTNLVATLQAGPQVRLTWRDNAINESGFVIERSTDGVNFTQIATAPARSNTGNVTFTDTTIKAAQTTQAYTYRVAAANVAGLSAYATSNTVAVGVVVPPAAPTNLIATLQAGPTDRTDLDGQRHQ